MRSTIVLVHGAFAESASWNGVAETLVAAGHPVVAAANPLRSLATDAQSVTDLVASIDGPVTLVGHSYGGAVITNVHPDAGDIRSLVYVAAFAPEPGESAGDLAAKFPGSTLGDSLQPVPRTDGSTDLYIRSDVFRSQFAADVPEAETARMAIAQRPITEGALGEAAKSALWRAVPSWFVIAEADQNIPAAAQHFMAERAGARAAESVAGGSHAVAVSRPEVTARVILDAAAVDRVTA